ncbi:MAG: hypothetical protein AB8I08_10710 [Sandaracinaceae bacterium]
MLNCDVCENFRPEANLRERTITRVTFGTRTVDVCESHRRIAERSDVKTFEGLRELYGEADGRRSYVARRGRSDDTHRRAGRRKTDVLD